MSEGRCKKSQEAFLALVRAGLWGVSNDNVNDNENFVDGLAVSVAEVLRLAEEQSVVGLVTAGVEKTASWHFTAYGEVDAVGYVSAD